MATKIDGTRVAADVADELRRRMEAWRVQAPAYAPALGVVLVGERKDSATYVRMKMRRADELGVRVELVRISAEASTEDVVAAVQRLNDDASVHGIIVQLPLPAHCDEVRVLDAVRADKDVDGFHPANLGAIAVRGRRPHYVPCTPRGCIELLDRLGVPIEGKVAVVLGRSPTVGLPVALLLLARNATVTVCHSKTADAAAACRTADIVIAAIGRAELVRGDWLKPGAVVIDVGINHVEDSSRKTGFRMVGDVAYDEAVAVASAITPVPGGVGPMTIAMLMVAVAEAAARAHGLPL